MCILDFITNSKSNQDDAAAFVHFCDSSPSIEKKFTKDYNNNFVLNQKREWDVKTADFASENSSADEMDVNISSCTLCTSSFSFCNASQRSSK